MGSTGTRYFNTRAGATIYRHETANIRGIKRSDLSPLKLSSPEALGRGRGGAGSLISVNYQNSLGTTAAFTLTIKPGTMDPLRDVLAGDWVVWWWIINGQEVPGHMGRVVTQAIGTTSVNGATVTTLTLECQGFGSVFEKTTVWFDEYGDFDRTNVAGAFVGKRMNLIAGGRPDAAIQRLVQAFMGKEGVIGGAWIWPKGLDWLGEYFVQGLQVEVARDRPLDFELNLAVIDLKGDDAGQLRGRLISESIFQPQPGAMLLNMMNEWSNSLLNELFFDLRPRKKGERPFDPQRPIPTMVIREKPFPNVVENLSSHWFELPIFEIPKNYLQNVQLSRSDAERANMFFVYSASTPVTQYDQYALFLPEYDVDDAARHGLRKMEQSTRFSGFGGKNGGGELLGEVSEWKKLLTSWYALNAYFLAGTVNLKQVWPTVRIGERLRIGRPEEQDTLQFYVEGINSSWTFPSAGTTSFTVTRGWQGTDRDYMRAVLEASSRYIGAHPRSAESTPVISEGFA